MTDDVEHPVAHHDNAGGHSRAPRASHREKHDHEYGSPRQVGGEAVAETDFERMKVTTGAASVQKLDSLDSGEDEAKGEQVSRHRGEYIGTGRQFRTPGSREESDSYVSHQHFS